METYNTKKTKAERGRGGGSGMKKRE